MTRPQPGAHDRVGARLGERRRPLPRVWHGTTARDALRSGRAGSGIDGTAYDTAWLAALGDPADRRAARFPVALQWLIEHQHADGSWGGAVRYEHDRVLSTLAALTALSARGRRARDRAGIEAGTRYLWRHGHLLRSEPVELVGFELLLPSLVQRAQAAGVAVPPHLDVYREQRAEKLRLIPPELLYSPRTTAVHSLEFLGAEVDAGRLAAAQGANGSIGNSPAATAFFLGHHDEAFGPRNGPAAAAYLEECLRHTGGATAPVLHPCETFELLWAAYHLYLGGVPAAELLTPERRRLLRQALAGGGVSLSPTTFPIPDADDTAVALLLLHDLGEPVDPSALRSFALPGGHFASFPHERHPSIGVNLHVLHALLRVPGYPEQETVVGRLVDYALEQQVAGLYWIDKWHISPYYATAHALGVFAELGPSLASRVAPSAGRALEWVRHTQRGDGSWGFYDQATLEETAYCLLALATQPGELSPADRQRCLAGLRYLDRSAPADRTALPPLWVDKCLYVPPLVVQAAVEAAVLAVGRRLGPRRGQANTPAATAAVSHGGDR
jgi:halimadienyl-diphosphate synthase